MKKTISMLLALTLALGLCVPALAAPAETVTIDPASQRMYDVLAAGKAIRETVDLKIDQETLLALISMFASSEEADMTPVVQAALAIADAINAEITVQSDAAKMSLNVNGAPVLAVGGILDGQGGVSALCSLLPSYVIKANAGLNSFADGASYAQILSLVKPYAADIEAALPAFAAEAEQGEFEVGGQSYAMRSAVTVTSHALTNIALGLIERLEKDEALLSMIMSLAPASQSAGLADSLTKAKEDVAASLEEEDSDILTGYLYANAEQTCLRLFVAGGLGLIEFVKPNDAQSASVMLVMAQTAVEDWDAAIASAQSGEDSSLTLVNLDFVTANTEETAAGAISMSVIMQGMSIGANVSGTTALTGDYQYSGITEIIFSGVTLLTLDMQAAETEAFELPDTSQLTVIADPTALTDEEKAAIQNEMMTTGLGGVMAALMQAMPDEMTVITNYLTAAQEAAETPATEEVPAEDGTVPAA